ncbi:hypothetical protein [Demequina litorisediminis]|uniref:WXG100 family type VII secretion target n=1 Tax=Demequina litorisediminis TaxID=1849022 RepID=A0ABQ6IIE4_9MICO|nr:hypothetical protein [Demequina litorisediminis]GMA36932.1 hypothetical protein GCM10025876_31360 [Demequina litorisediminis]
MSISLEIPGDPAAIRTAAEWLDPTLKGSISTADIELVSTITDAQYLWTGQSGYAFNSAAQAVRRSNHQVPGYAADVAEVMRAYAGRLERGAEDFTEYASRARDEALTVTGNAIAAPTTWLKYCPDPSGPDSAELREWNRYTRRVEAYQDIASDVGTWWGELDAWIAEHFGPLVQRVSELQEGATALDGLTQGNEEVVGLAFEYASARTARNLAEFRTHVSDLQTQADDFQRGLRSGNPAVRAAAEAADPRGMRAGIGVLNETIAGVSKSARIIPIAGGVIEVVSAGAEIASGESPSSVGIGLVGGIAGGSAVAGGIAAAGVAVPPLGVALLVAGGAWALGEGAQWAWEAWVPLDTREAIDDGLRDFGGWLNPFD